MTIENNPFGIRIDNLAAIVAVDYEWIIQQIENRIPETYRDTVFYEVIDVLHDLDLEQTK